MGKSAQIDVMTQRIADLKKQLSDMRKADTERTRLLCIGLQKTSESLLRLVKESSLLQDALAKVRRVEDDKLS